MTHQNQMGGTAPINLKKGFRIHLLVFLLTIPASGLYGTSPTEPTYGLCGKQVAGQWESSSISWGYLSSKIKGIKHPITIKKQNHESATKNIQTHCDRS